MGERMIDEMKKTWIKVGGSLMIVNLLLGAVYLGALVFVVRKSQLNLVSWSIFFAPLPIFVLQTVLMALAGALVWAKTRFFRFSVTLPVVIVPFLYLSSGFTDIHAAFAGNVLPPDKFEWYRICVRAWWVFHWPLMDQIFWMEEMRRGTIALDFYRLFVLGSYQLGVTGIFGLVLDFFRKVVLDRFEKRV